MNSHHCARLAVANQIPEMVTEPGGRNPESQSAPTFRELRRILMPGLLIFGLIVLGALFVAAPSHAAEIAVSVNIGPPPLPVYTQPVCPQPGYMWTPGYWAYDPADGYYWVPGTWVLAPQPGLLWTPGYWGWGGAAFNWHAGYWGPHVGFYGGINYGFGYIGVGFVGGEWRGGAFFYNRAVTNINVVHITNVYSRTVVNNFAVNRVSYNGGRGGLAARPSAGELAAEHDRHFAATNLQHHHEMAAHGDRSQFASVNHGRPDVAATGRPGEFRGGQVVPSSRAGGAVNPETFHGANAGHPGAYSGARTPNPGGGGGRQVMTAHQNPSSGHGTEPSKTQGQYRSRSGQHNESSHAASSQHGNSHPSQHNERSSESPKDEKREGESRR
jgi:hypothetical protein